jgi:hypothetical protein
MTIAEKAEVINFASAWLDHKVAAFVEDLRQLERQVAEICRRIDRLPPARKGCAVKT